MKLKASGVNKAHLVVASNSPDKPCPRIEFDPDDFYDGVVLSMNEAAQINQMLLGLIDYLDDENEKHKADLPLALLFQRFPDSEVRLKTSKCVVFVQKGDMETYEPELLIPDEFSEPTHAKKVQQNFAEKEALAYQIFKEVAQELSRLGRATSLES